MNKYDNMTAFFYISPRKPTKLRRWLVKSYGLYNRAPLYFIIYTTWKGSMAQPQCIDLSWPLTNRHRTWEWLAIYFHYGVDKCLPRQWYWFNNGICYSYTLSNSKTKSRIVIWMIQVMDSHFPTCCSQYQAA